MTIQQISGQRTRQNRRKCKNPQNHSHHGIAAAKLLNIKRQYRKNHLKTKKHHKVNCFVTADVPPVYADKYDIERVVLNILTNSIKYTPDGGEIKIYVGFVYNDAYIKVIDNGIGIPEEDIEKVFERFYRVDKARSREMGGTGLGLSIAKEILEKNNSKINKMDSNK